MRNEQDRQEAVMMGSSNESALLNQNFMELRLDINPLITKIEMFLSAKKEIHRKSAENGDIYVDYEQVGEPLANDAGINNLLNIIQLSANQHVVQGNLERTDYQDLMADTRKELTEQIVINCYNWAIDDMRINLIIDTIMRFLKLYLSRPIENLERLSYNQQFASREIVHQGKRNNAIQDFAGGIVNAR